MAFCAILHCVMVALSVQAINNEAVDMTDSEFADAILRKDEVLLVDFYAVRYLLLS